MSGILGIPAKAFGSAALTVDSVLVGEEDTGTFFCEFCGYKEKFNIEHEF